MLTIKKLRKIKKRLEIIDRAIKIETNKKDNSELLKKNDIKMLLQENKIAEFEKDRDKLLRMKDYYSVDVFANWGFFLYAIFAVIYVVFESFTKDPDYITIFFSSIQGSISLFFAVIFNFTQSSLSRKYYPHMKKYRKYYHEDEIAELEDANSADNNGGENKLNGLYILKVKLMFLGCLLFFWSIPINTVIKLTLTAFLIIVTFVDVVINIKESS